MHKELRNMHVKWVTNTVPFTPTTSITYYCFMICLLLCTSMLKNFFSILLSCSLVISAKKANFLVIKSGPFHYISAKWVNPWSWIFIIFRYVFLHKIISSMQKKIWNRMCGSQVMRGLILETTRRRQWYQETKNCFFVIYYC